MLTILAIAGAAITAVRAYNRKKTEDPEGTEIVVHQIRQSTSVVLAVANACWAVLDALIFLTRSFGGGGGGGQQSNGKFTFGRQVAADVSPAEA